MPVVPIKPADKDIVVPRDELAADPNYGKIDIKNLFGIYGRLDDAWNDIKDTVKGKNKKDVPGRPKKEGEYSSVNALAYDNLDADSYRMAYEALVSQANKKGYNVVEVSDTKNGYWKGNTMYINKDLKYKNPRMAAKVAAHEMYEMKTGDHDAARKNEDFIVSKVISELFSNSALMN